MHGPEFQTLTGVHGHEPYRVDSFDGRRWFAQCALIAEHLQPPDPAEQPALRVAFAGTVVFDRELEELMDGEPPLVVSSRVAGKIVADEARARIARYTGTARARS